MNENQDLDTRKRVIPKSNVDFDAMTVNTEWGSAYIPEILRRKLTKEYEVKKIINNKEYVTYEKEDLWALLGFYTRDLRLANLSTMNGELNYCQYYLDLANDFLRADFIEPFLICLSRVATQLELSQSKGGFLRRRMNTFTHEQYSQELEPPKKNLFGISKKPERY